MVKKKTQSAVYTLLITAEEMARGNQLVTAELKYLEALRMAERDFGPEDDQVMLVLSILAAFYHAQGRTIDAHNIELRLEAWQMPAVSKSNSDVEEVDHKFVGSSRAGEAAPPPSGVRVPANLRQPCQILGLPMDQAITVASINGAWKKQMLSSAAHPDLGGNTEEAVLLNRAKETLMAFLESRKPNLGAKFIKE
jgi:hypothetical protein